MSFLCVYCQHLLLHDLPPKEDNTTQDNSGNCCVLHSQKLFRKIQSQCFFIPTNFITENKYVFFRDCITVKTPVNHTFSFVRRFPSSSKICLHFFLFFYFAWEVSAENQI